MNNQDFNMSIEFPEGVLWEDNPMTIQSDKVCSEFSGSPCRHSVNHKIETHQSSDGGTYTEKTWENPFVVIGINEGGHSSVGLCLLCVIDAVRAFKKENRRLQRSFKP